MLCILYVNAMGWLFGVVGLVVERALPATFSRRWVWCVVIAASLFVPGYYRANHSVSVADVLGQQAVPSAHTPGAAPLAPMDPAWWTHVQSLDPVINRAWMVASALLVLWGLASAWRVSRLVNRARGPRARGGGSMVVDGVAVVVTESAGPATVGFWRSRVLVPRWVLALPGIQRRYVLRHEDEHRRAHDAHLLFGASLLLILVPWSLALWWQLRRLRLAVEMDCDNRVVAALGDAPAYGEMLFKVAEAANRSPRLQPALLGGVGMLESRLRKLLAPPPRRYVQRFLLPVVALGLLAFVLSIPHPVVASGDHAHVTTTTAANPATQR